MSSRLNLAFYIREIIPIGGVSTWLSYVIPDLQRYHDITLFYEKADKTQLEKFKASGINALRITDTPAETFDVLFRSYDKDPNIKAKIRIHTIHSCISEATYGFTVHGKIDRFLAVSDRVKESFLEVYPKEKRPIDVVYNYVPSKPIKPKEPFDGTIKMVMASRLSKEKGLMSLIQMVRTLNASYVNYHLDLFTVFPKIPHLDNGRVSFVPPRLDIDFSKYHYLIQLSDSEAYCYTVHEALSVGTAVIVKDLPVFKGIVKHGYNGYIYPNVNDNVRNIPTKFNYKPTGSVEKWLDYLKNIV